VNERLTDRQLQILSLVARGGTNRRIGEELGISERTVRNHLRTILRKLSSPNRTHAVALASGNGWIAIPIEVLPIEAVEVRSSPGRTTPDST
jgi:DNA-binding CsgD family transcriptional regulator